MKNFWQGRRVLVTGHTGFKGSWLCEMLIAYGAKVSGFALPALSEDDLFQKNNLSARVEHNIGDVRDPCQIQAVVKKTRPEFIFHLAAQSLVVPSYERPVETWDVNLMGTVHLLNAVRNLAQPTVVILVTTDKVYENVSGSKPLKESDQLGGVDPYSASKAAMEIAVRSWRRAFFSTNEIRLATARAGNVIGGGDWAKGRIIPDIIRAFQSGNSIKIRSPKAVRPWQHVIEPLMGYLQLAQKIHEGDGAELQDGINFGPDAAAFCSVEDLVQRASSNLGVELTVEYENPRHEEAECLLLDSSKARRLLGWEQTWDFAQAIDKTVEFYLGLLSNRNSQEMTWEQINEFTK